MQQAYLIGLIISSVIILLLIISTIFPKLGHAIFGWHKPCDKIDYDGCSFTSRCKYCGKEILQDSQGNWF